MSLQFSFKQSFFHHVLVHANELFPGATRVVAMYYSKEKSGIETLAKDLNSKENSKINKGIDLSSFEKYRHQRPRYSWIDLEIPEFKEGNKQLEIQGEYKKHSLLIRFPNAYDTLHDFLLISFKNEDQIFRMNENQHQLSTEMKQTVASVYVRSLDVIRKQIESDKQIDSIIQIHNSSLLKAESGASEELLCAKNNHNSLVRSILERRTKEISIGLEYSFEWENAAVDYIGENLHTLDIIEDCVKSALIMAINDFKGNDEHIHITNAHVRSASNPVIKKADPQVDTRYHRSIALLDRYEQAAAEVIKNKLRVTGNHLGEHMTPSISPAAISDAIRKHSSKITYLLNTYPNKWSILRRHFKPIQNKIYAPVDMEQKAS